MFQFRNIPQCTSLGTARTESPPLNIVESVRSIIPVPFACRLLRESFDLVINDEQPAIQSWAQEKFTNGTGPQFNHLFYANVFELLLRLRANYLWASTLFQILCHLASDILF